MEKIIFSWRDFKKLDFSGGLFWHFLFAFLIFLVFGFFQNALANTCDVQACYSSTGFGNSTYNGSWIATGTYNGFTRFYNQDTASSAAVYMYVTDTPTNDYWGMNAHTTEGAGAYAIGANANQCPDSGNPANDWGVDAQGTAPAGIVAIDATCGVPASTSTATSSTVSELLRWQIVYLLDAIEFFALLIFFSWLIFKIFKV